MPLILKEDTYLVEIHNVRELLDYLNFHFAKINQGNFRNSEALNSIKNVIEKLEEKKEMDNVIPFERAKLLTGGGTPPPNWLKTKEPGTVIICRPKPIGGYPQDAACKEFVVVKHEGPVTLLYSDLNPPPMVTWVETEIFSKTVDLIHQGKAKKDVDF